MSSYFSRGPRRNNAQYLQPAPPRRISTTAGQRLDTIVEGDGTTVNRPADAAWRSAPPSTQATHGPTWSGLSRLHNPPFARRLNHGEPPLASDEKPPPSYRSQPSEPGTSDERSNLKTWFTNRGGWRRLALLVFAILAVIAIALGVGLGVGLKKRSNGNTTPEASGMAPSSPSNQPPQSFPVGTWNLPVALTNTSTDCTSSSPTWTCFPYQTFSQSQAGSLFTFNWVISSSAAHASNDSLQIASSPDPFGLSFPATKLSLLDPGTSAERYTFSLPVPKQDSPTASLAQDGARTTCFFNQTMLFAALYTHPQQSGVPSGADSAWPGTVYVEQRSPGGQNVPDCYQVDVKGNVDGSSITQGLDPQPANARCSCVWDTVNGTLVGTG